MPGPVRGVADLPVGAHDVQGSGPVPAGAGRGRRRCSPGPSDPDRGRPSSSRRPRSCGEPTLDGEVVTTPEPDRGPAAPGHHRRPTLRARRPGRARPGAARAARSPTPATRPGGTAPSSWPPSAALPPPPASAPRWAPDPAADSGFDLALTELDDDDGHRFVVRVGTERGAEVLRTAARVRGHRRRTSTPATGCSHRRPAPWPAAARPRGCPISWPATSSTPAGTRWPSGAWPVGTAPWSARPASAATSRDTTDLTGEVARQRYLGVVLRPRPLLPPRGPRAGLHLVALPPVAHPQAVDLVGPVRHARDASGAAAASPGVRSAST